jgi:hypothetical protein
MIYRAIASKSGFSPWELKFAEIFALLASISRIGWWIMELP